MGCNSGLNQLTNFTSDGTTWQRFVCEDGSCTNCILSRSVAFPPAGGSIGRPCSDDWSHAWLFPGSPRPVGPFEGALLEFSDSAAKDALDFEKLKFVGYYEPDHPLFARPALCVAMSEGPDTTWLKCRCNSSSTAPAILICSKYNASTCAESALVDPNHVLGTGGPQYGVFACGPISFPTLSGVHSRRVGMEWSRNATVSYAGSCMYNKVTANSVDPLMYQQEATCTGPATSDDLIVFAGGVGSKTYNHPLGLYPMMAWVHSGNQEWSPGKFDVFREFYPNRTVFGKNRTKNPPVLYFVQLNDYGMRHHNVCIPDTWTRSMRYLCEETEDGGVVVMYFYDSKDCSGSPTGVTRYDEEQFVSRCFLHDSESNSGGGSGGDDDDGGDDDNDLDSSGSNFFPSFAKMMPLLLLSAMMILG